jgi:hypothetical protein
MPFSVKQISDDIVEVVYDGPISEVDATNATNECVQLQRKLSIMKFLVVADNAEIDIQPERVREAAGKGYRLVELRRSTRIAMIRPKTESGRRFSDVYEETCRKRGWNARVFPDRLAAIRWLEGPDTP